MKNYAPKCTGKASPRERSEIESEIDQLESKLEASKSLDTSLREELTSLTGLFKGRKHREIISKIEAETAKQEAIQKRIESLTS